jgi:hypothetical protein
VEAVRLSASNITDVAHWCGGRVDGRIVEQSIYGSSYQDLRYLSIPTLEGVMRADIGDLETYKLIQRMRKPRRDAKPKEDA